MLFKSVIHRFLFMVVCFSLPNLAMSEKYDLLPDYVPAKEVVQTTPVTKKHVPTQRAASKKKRLKKRRKKPYTYQRTVEPFHQEIRLIVGETRVVREPNAGRLAVGNGEVISAAVLDDKEILIIANNTGISSLHIWTANGKNRRILINVVPSETKKVTREIAAFLRKIPNAQASVVGDKVVVEGDNMSDTDLAKIETLAKSYPQIINFTNQLGWEKMITMDVRVVEFPSDLLREVGVRWRATGGAAVGAFGQLGRRGRLPSTGLQINQVSPIDAQAPITGLAGGTAVIPSSINVLSVLNAGFNAQLSLLEQNGTATILARPTLSTRSGTTAKFLAGGEIPYSVSNINGTTVLFKNYGIKLDIEPRVDHNGVIRAKIRSEVSEIDAAQGSTIGGPALLTRMTESEFNAKQGETIVLSGLLQRSKSVSIDKLPVLGDVPILGALFRSKRYQDKETELVIFVTPTANNKHSEAQQRSMEEANDRVKEAFISKQDKPLNEGSISDGSKELTSEAQSNNARITDAQKLLYK